jgi:hypothetical protein
VVPEPSELAEALPQAARAAQAATAAAVAGDLVAHDAAPGQMALTFWLAAATALTAALLCPLLLNSC